MSAATELVGIDFGSGQILSADLRDFTDPNPHFKHGEQLLHVRYPNGCELFVIYLASGNRKIFSVAVYAVDIDNDLWRLLCEWITPKLSPELLAAVSARAELERVR